MYTNAFIANFPRRSRPRGLGYAGGVGNTLGGLGTWVVDTEYGLGPRFREGFNRPYNTEVMRTQFPRAQAARVLGPAAAVNVVARPYAATRKALTRYPVRMAPITAPGAALRNPGVAGYGFLVDDGILAVGMAAKETPVWAPTLAGAAAGMLGKATLSGKAKDLSGWVALGGLALGGINFIRKYMGILDELKTTGAAATGPATVQGAMNNAKEVIEDPQTAADAAKRGVLAQYACYENARRTNSWWARMRGTARDPLKDCGMTSAQAAVLKASFDKISRADRQRLGGNVYKPGGSLEDLG